MRSPHFVRLALAALALAGAHASPAAGQALLSSFDVADGPLWTTAPDTYTCLEACALLNGGDPADYACSTSASSLDHQAFVSGWGTGEHCTTPVAEDFEAGDQVTDCGSAGCYYSAYVDDWCGAGVTNHCWLPSCGDGTLDAGEVCDDGNGADGDCCSANCQVPAPAEQSCGDGDACNGDELCDGAGACAAGTPLDCADERPCSQDSCDALLGCQNPVEPAPVCDEAAGKVALALDAAKRKASFSWKKGSVDFAELGAPTEDTAYTLCVYDAGDAPVVEIGVPGGGVCAGKPCWRAVGKAGQETGLRFKDKAGTSDGVRSVRLEAHAAGKAKLSLQAKGEATPPPALGGGLSAPVTAQLVSSEGACWGAVFEADDIQKSDAERLKATRKNLPE